VFITNYYRYEIDNRGEDHSRQYDRGIDVREEKRERDLREEPSLRKGDNRERDQE
jgi:hypothetical protein